MTTIAWDGKHLVADTRCTSTMGLVRRVEKAWKLENGTLFASCGSPEQNVIVRAWLNGETPKPTFPMDDFTGIQIAADKSIWIYEKLLAPWRIFDPNHAIGSGRDFALAAMALGKTALEAVELAAQFDAWTAAPFTVLKL